MKNIAFRKLGVILMLFPAVTVFLFRWIPGAGEWYARQLYPGISFLFSAAASVVPFSLCEVCVISVLLFLFIYPWWMYGKKKMKILLLHELGVLALFFAWFYWTWGMNYFRDDWFVRSGVRPAVYEEEHFRRFLSVYTDSLNEAFTAQTFVGEAEMENEIKRLYKKVPERFGLSVPYSFQHPKKSLVNTLYSRVGVLGFMGPFFCESHLNHELLPVQRPFTYAHELSHLLGVSSEAEANFWAWQICICSSNQSIRYSGYLGLLPYVFSNARGLLSETDFRKWVQTVRPEVLLQFSTNQEYWKGHYSKWLGAVQSAIYDFYLKGNRISSGQRNYAEVIGMILSFSAKDERNNVGFCKFLKY